MVTELEALFLTFSKQPLLRLTCPRRLGAGPITEPGGREAGMRARTGASTILMLLRLIRLLYLATKHREGVADCFYRASLLYWRGHSL